MPLFLDTTGQPSLAIGICDRCKRKFPIAQLHPDRNSPGLMVCRDDNDVKDPWRLPFVPKDADISVKRPRPDTSIENDVCYTIAADGAVVVGTCPVDTTVRPSST